MEIADAAGDGGVRVHDLDERVVHQRISAGLPAGARAEEGDVAPANGGGARAAARTTQLQEIARAAGDGGVRVGHLVRRARWHCPLINALLSARTGAEEGDVVPANCGGGLAAARTFQLQEIARAAGDRRVRVGDVKQRVVQQRIHTLLAAGAGAEEGDVAPAKCHAPGAGIIQLQEIACAVRDRRVRVGDRDRWANRVCPVNALLPARAGAEKGDHCSAEARLADAGEISDAARDWRRSARPDGGHLPLEGAYVAAVAASGVHDRRIINRMGEAALIGGDGIACDGVGCGAAFVNRWAAEKQGAREGRAAVVLQ